MRKETKLPGCLLTSKTTTYPQTDVLVCGLCPARSDDIGDLGQKCVAPKR